ncbi:uncharacterized protein LOC122526162 [Polistes fuscatus]|uniref:uncharacterized protein LOC122526162 n=1 Tax=Polistes fuscatus TaxID=30207 RepID=UPI001CA9F702|nr:uncharacterized protein LOC122526162 [Polistes fuscatus]
MGEIRLGRGGRYEATVVAPTALAQAAIEKGTIVVGWGKVRVFPIRPRPLRCQRCLARGHVAASCPAPSARLSLCFKCGEPGHVARVCEDKPRCPVCAEAGRSQTSHRAGSWGCPLVPPIRGKDKILEAASRRVGDTGSAGAGADSGAASFVNIVNTCVNNNNGMKVEQADPAPQCNLDIVLG